MEIFLDSFSIESVEKYSAYLTGITTNPTIIAKSFENMVDFKNQVQALVKTFPNLLINLQVTKNTVQEMVQEARVIAEYGPNLIVKVPSTFEGLSAIKEITKMGLRTNATLCFSLAQAQIAQDMGATYISPFLGRMQDAGNDIEEFIHNMRNIITSSKILAASLRNVEHIELAVGACCDAITISENVFDSIFQQKLLVDGKNMFDSVNKVSYI